MTIEYTRDYLCGEPGPNLYFRGNSQEFFDLVCLLKALAFQRLIIKREAIVNGKKSFISFLSQKEAKILNAYVEETNEVVINLDFEYWKELLLRLFLIYLKPGRIYVDMDEEFGLKADANFIIDSNL